MVSNRYSHLAIHFFVNMGCLCIYVCLKMRLCLFSTSFDKTWYVEAAIYTENRLFSHSIVCYFWWIGGGDRVKLTKCDTGKWAEQCHMQVSSFLNDPMANLLFYCHIILYWKKVTSLEIYPRSYPWSQSCLESSSVSMLLMEVLKYWKIVEFPKTSIKMKNFKIFCQVQIASRPKEIIQASTR